jgi:hypothetical protein
MSYCRVEADKSLLIRVSELSGTAWHTKQTNFQVCKLSQMVRK